MGKAGWGLTLDTSEPLELLSPRWNFPVKPAMFSGVSPKMTDEKNSNRKVLSEVDFFSTSKSNDDQIVVKKENISHATELDVNVSVNSLIDLFVCIHEKLPLYNIYKFY